MSEEIILLTCALALTPIAIFIAMALFWCFVIWLISVLGGWTRLVERYRATQPASGHHWWNQYGRVNGARYGNVLNLTTNETGLFLEVSPLFRFNHTPLFIPWSDLHNPTPVTYRYRELIRVDVGSPTVATLSLPPEVIEESEGHTILGTNPGE